VTAPTVGPDGTPAGKWWRGIAWNEEFTCTECGHTLLYGGGQQTIDGARRLCHDCDKARLAAIWAAKPDGLYRINFLNHSGEVTCSATVRKGPKPT
jgi:hypothetical protein